MRVGSDVAIARYAFKPSSNKSLKFQNRVLIVSPPMSFRTSGGGSAVGARRKLRGFVFTRYLFKRQTFAAHGRGGLVTFAAPKVTKRRSHVIRNASSRTVLPHNQAKPRAAAFFPH